MLIDCRAKSSKINGAGDQTQTLHMLSTYCTTELYLHLTFVVRKTMALNILFFRVPKERLGYIGKICDANYLHI
jgi:hypothetical protein